MRLNEISYFYENTSQSPESDEFADEGFYRAWATIKKKLDPLGYKMLGYGADQMAFLEPSTGLVLKIFGRDVERIDMDNFGDIELDRFMKWVEFCTKNKANPYLPKFYGWSKFTLGAQTFLQIRTDRLYEASTELTEFGEALSTMVHFVRRSSDQKKNRDDYFKILKGKDYWDKQDMDKIATLVLLIGGEDKFNLFWDTIAAVVDYGKKEGLQLDLHSGNFMLTKDGVPVINDPYHGGASRASQTRLNFYTNDSNANYDDNSDIDSYRGISG